MAHLLLLVISTMAIQIASAESNSRKDIHITRRAGGDSIPCFNSQHRANNVTTCHCKANRTILSVSDNTPNCYDDEELRNTTKCRFFNVVELNQHKVPLSLCQPRDVLSIGYVALWDVDVKLWRFNSNVKSTQKNLIYHCREENFLEVKTINPFRYENTVDFSSGIVETVTKAKICKSQILSCLLQNDPNTPCFI